MSARSGRLARTLAADDHDDKPDERWMASYMDMVTVLMCMFIVLFAMSSIDVGKYEQLRDSLTEGFGGEVHATAATAPPEPDAVHAAAAAELTDLSGIQQRITDALAAQGLQDTVTFAIDSRGLTVRLHGSETYFASGSDALSVKASRVLDAVGPVLAAAGRDIAVEGHADTTAAGGEWATNWELSAGRAVAVLRNLVEHSGVAGGRISATGFGDSRPLSADLAQNRRVDIVVATDEAEEVRALLG